MLTRATNLASYYAKLGNSVVDCRPCGAARGWRHARRAGDPRLARLARGSATPAAQQPITPSSGSRAHECARLNSRRWCGAQSIVILKKRSPTDTRAAAHFIHHLLLVGRVERKETKLAVVANRVRENTALQK